jgi:pimeloyl-ACP methyl ester carboxylesterase
MISVNIRPMQKEGSIKTRDGRDLAWMEVGDPDGALVIHHHGGPSSRLEARLFSDVAARHGLRFVCVDRPGIGRSTPLKNRTQKGWADDLVTLAEGLGHREFGVTGWSEGGPWALAAAAYIDSARLRHVSSIAGGSYGALGENWAARHLSKIDAFGGFLALHFEPGFRLLYTALGITAAHFRETYFKQLLQAVNDYDQRIMRLPGIENLFCEMSAECFAHGSDGLVRDSEVLYRAWEFDVASITRPIHMWQGTDDRLVPAIINREVANHMPGAVWHEVEGGGHFIAMGCADEFLRIAASELH